jgi:hypothetical protein
MQSAIVYFHSITRYFILFFAVIVAVQSLIGLLGKKEFRKANKMAALALLIFCDLQLLVGLYLYYTFVVASGMLRSGSVMKDPASRFWAVEHSVSMIVAIVLVHIGYAAAKKPMENDQKFKRVFWCSFVALCIFVAMIPWEGKQVVGRPNIPVLTNN